jgi:hypothetical protein
MVPSTQLEHLVLASQPHQAVAAPVDPFQALVGRWRLARACEPYLMSALLVLPEGRRNEAIASLQVSYFIHTC